MSDSFDAADLRHLLDDYVRLLAAHETEINALNVFPVADGDTGTNMLSTVRGVVEALPDDSDDLAELSKAGRRAALMSARGSSGIIFCQWLRSFLNELASPGGNSNAGLARALAAAADSAYEAVEEPVEGTMLTVARASAEATDGSTSIPDLWRNADKAAEEALARTPDLLPVLKRAGVVDSGARALTLLFDAATGTSPDTVALVAVTAQPEVAIHASEESPRFEATFLLQSDSASPLLERWRGLGNAIVVAGDGTDGGWRCHIHTDYPDAAVDAGRASGLVQNVRIEELTDEFSASGDTGSLADVRTAVVAVAVGDGLSARMRELGAVVVQCAKTMNASIGEIAEAISATGAARVLVLPGDPDTVGACTSACELVEADARLVGAVSLGQVLAALEAYDASAEMEENARVMEGCLDSPWAEVARVVRRAETRIGDVSEGQWIVISEEGIVHVANDPVAAAAFALDALDHRTEIEIYPGRQASLDLTDTLIEAARRHHPGTEIALRDGGQPYQAWLIRPPIGRRD